MEPGKDPNLFSGLYAVQGLNKRRKDFQVGIRRAFPSLTRSFGTLLQRGMNLTDGGDGEQGHRGVLVLVLVLEGDDTARRRRAIRRDGEGRYAIRQAR